MTTAAPAASHRYIGVTDDSTECDRCGRTELRSTVVLAVLDADGNDDGVVYYGSSCAARALGRPAREGAKVLDLARGAHERLRGEARQALEFLAFVGVDLTGRPMFERDGQPKWGPAARRYGMANPMRHATREELAARDTVAQVQEAVARKLRVVNDALTVGVLTR